MKTFRRCKVQKVLVALVLLVLCTVTIEFVIYATNKTVLRIAELFNRKRILNEEVLRHLPKYDVIISAYMNSGSTYTGKILGFRKDAFYFYEPLWRLTLWGYFKSNYTVCSTRTDMCQIITKDEINKNKPVVGRSKQGLDFHLLHDKEIINMSVTPLQVAKRIIHHVLRCRLLQVKNLIQPGVTDNTKLSGHSWNIYNYCMNRNKPFEHCLEVLQSSNCLTAKHRVSKVLRLSLGALEDILRASPNLKVVHLFRDPRAIIHSRIETHGYPLEKHTSHNGIKNNAKSLCNKIMTDYKDGKRLKKMFPTRFRFIHYEDIYTKVESLIALHTYLGMSINQEIIHNARVHVTNYGNNRKRSARSERNRNNAFWWRKYFSWNLMKLVDSECSSLYSKLGYPIILDKHDKEYFNESFVLQNLQFPVT